MYGLHDVGNVACLASAVESSAEELQNFQEAWNHLDKQEHAGWREGIKKEFGDMQTKKVWKVIKKVEIPENSRLVGNK